MAMAMDPEFFTPRTNAHFAHDPGIDLARRALLAALDVALAPAEEREAIAGRAFRALRAVCFEANPADLIGLTFPLGGDALLECLGRTCGTWLPYADELGVADDRLLLLGWPTAACGEIRRRLA
jgi:hypothetical protein